MQAQQHRDTAERFDEAIRLLRDGDPSRRRVALAELGGLGRDANRARLVLISACNDPDEAVRRLARDVLGGLLDEETSPVWAESWEALIDPDESVRLAAIRRVVRAADEVHRARWQELAGWEELRELTPAEVPDRPMDIDALKLVEGGPDEPLNRVLRENRGKWIAWNKRTRHLYGVAGDGAAEWDLLPDDEDGDEEDTVSYSPTPEDLRAYREIMPWESPDVVADVHLLWGGTAGSWLEAKNSIFRELSPNELIARGDSMRVRFAVRSVRYGDIS